VELRWVLSHDSKCTTGCAVYQPPELAGHAGAICSYGDLTLVT
jgi:hypothetical protein